jgi:hypothetical protein
MFIMLMRSRFILGDTIEDCVANAISEGYIQCIEDIATGGIEIDFYEIADNPLSIEIEIPKPVFKIIK